MVWSLTSVRTNQHGSSLSLYIQHLVKLHAAIAVENYFAIGIAIIRKNVRPFQSLGRLVKFFNQFKKAVAIRRVDSNELSGCPARPLLAIEQRQR